MAIWKLSPFNIGAPAWEASTYRGQVIVRAKNEGEARLCAMQRFVIATKVNHKEKMRMCPWIQHDLVSCEELVDSKYPFIGETIVLEPTGN